MAVRYHYPQASYSASLRLQALWAWWIILGGVVLGATGFLHFSEASMPPVLGRELERIGWTDLATVPKLVSWGIFTGATMLIGGALLNGATGWALRRRTKHLLRAIAALGLGLSIALTLPLTLNSYSLVRALPAVQAEDWRVGRALLLCSIFSLASFALILLQGLRSWGAFRETFTKALYPSVHLGSQVHVETAGEQDLPALRALYEESLAHAHESSEGVESWKVLELAKALDRCRVYRRRHEILGFSLDSQDTHRLHMLHVRRDSQKQGIGRTLLDDFVRRAEIRQEEKALATSYSPAYPAAGIFLRACGWLPTNERDGRGRILYKRPQA